MIRNTIIGLVFAISVMGQVNTNIPIFIKGNMGIKYNSRLAVGKVGISDEYTISNNISNSSTFVGTIKFKPYIAGTVYGVAQNASLNYEVVCGVFNSRIGKAIDVGRIYGSVPIDPNGQYNYDAGDLKLGVVGQGQIASFESKFGGTVLGKSLVKKSAGMLDSLGISRMIGGKTVTIKVKKSDKMLFQSHKLPSGPVPFYPDSIVNGSMVYDYDRFVWFFDNVTITYYFQGGQKTDRLTGNIRWVESPQRKSNGLGEYQFDVRLNEPPANESAVFNTAAVDEESFFAVDNALSALTGTMKYKDTIRDETVIASQVDIDLIGNKMSKQQCMNIYKLIFFSCIVPVNAE